MSVEKEIVSVASTDTIPGDTQIVWVQQTPFPPLPQVKLDRARFDDHIAGNHGEMAGREENLREGVARPTAVVDGNSRTGNVVFVNHSDSKSNGSPLVVVVNKTTASVVTALYDRRYQDVSSKVVLWPK